ncbi:MAG: serine/threonine-protein kinase [Desulfobacterales bacterium]
MTSRKLSYSILALTLVLVMTVLSSHFFGIDPLKRLDYLAYDGLSRLRQCKAGTQIVMVEIDDRSVQNIGSWPWPRSFIAELIEQLTVYETHTMGVALLYLTRELNSGLDEVQQFRTSLLDNPQTNQPAFFNAIDTELTAIEKKLDHDQQLIFAVRVARNVVLPVNFRLGDPADSAVPALTAWLKINSISSDKIWGAQIESSNGPTGLGNLPRNQSIVARNISEPYSDLSRKAGALGHTNLIMESDGIIRKIPHLISYQQREFLSFALQVAAKFTGSNLEDVQSKSAGLYLKHLKIPTDGHHRMLIDFSGQDANIQRFSFFDVINEKISPDIFQGKIVLVGVTAQGLASRYRTPTKTNVSALEVMANVIENIINEKHIWRPSWMFLLEVSAISYFGFFLLFVLPRVSSRLGALILGVFLLTWIGTSAILFITNGIWIKITAPLLLCLIGFSLVSRHRRLSEEKDENAELNKSLGLALQGQGMLDMAFEKFLKCSIKNKSVQELLYNLGLDFERKRMFNKALAVYRHILKAGTFKDIQQRISKLISLEKTIAMPAGSTPKKTTFLVENGAARPTLGRYEILKELGQGAMGTVYLGNDPNIDREVAIKTINYAEINAEELTEVKSRFFREAQAAGKLSHPNIVTIYDVGEDHDMAYIAMELLQGKDLTYFCNHNNQLPINRILQIITQVAEALGYAHNQDVVHRDIKPANIILMQNDQVKVADFGIARVVSTSKTQTGIIFGSPGYMSPEQVAGKRVDGRSDLFSMGIVFYELLTGKKPFNGSDITAIMYAIARAAYDPVLDIEPKTPGCCANIIDKLLTKGLSKRYKTAAQVVNDLNACLDGLS